MSTTNEGIARYISNLTDYDNKRDRKIMGSFISRIRNVYRFDLQISYINNAVCSNHLRFRASRNTRFKSLQAQDEYLVLRQVTPHLKLTTTTVNRHDFSKFHRKQETLEISTDDRCEAIKLLS